jgi:hypothetical protein
MTSTEFPSQGLIFWPVGCGDSTTIVVDDDHVLQIDLHDTAAADDEGATAEAVIDRLAEQLPRRDGKPYLSVFALTHGDQDHCRGFADLLGVVTIGEIWATPRLWREFEDDPDSLCDDARVFHQEVERRVSETRNAIVGGREPEFGDRVRIIGHDKDQWNHPYADLPDEYRSGPGHSIATLDGDDVSTRFEAFVHAPFKDDCAASRNETSLALQVTLKGSSGVVGHILFFGDLAHDTIMKIFDYSETADRADKVAWDVLLAPHHCSRRVMYVLEGGEEVLQQDVLDAFERNANSDSTVVVSSAPFPNKNDPGDNPPHIDARRRYEEIATRLVCTGEHVDVEAPVPVVFLLRDSGLELAEEELDAGIDADVAKALLAGAALVGGGVLLSRLVKANQERRRRRILPQPGLDRVEDSIKAVRGGQSPPQQPVAFGQVGD